MDHGSDLYFTLMIYYILVPVGWLPLQGTHPTNFLPSPHPTKEVCPSTAVEIDESNESNHRIEWIQSIDSFREMIPSSSHRPILKSPTSTLASSIFN